MFKLTEEMIQEIEEKVNNGLKDVNDGMKERLIAVGFYTQWACVDVCNIVINIEDSKVVVIDPIKTYDDEEEDEEDDW
jgi:NTP pyrophosphatase (non-canonical NTP hydrolase)